MQAAQPLLVHLLPRAMSGGALLEATVMPYTEDGFCVRNSGRADLFAHGPGHINAPVLPEAVPAAAPATPAAAVPAKPVTTAPAPPAVASAPAAPAAPAPAAAPAAAAPAPAEKA